MSILVLIQSGFFGLSGTVSMYIVGAVLTVILAYLIGSLNFSRLFAKRLDCKTDVFELNNKAGTKGVVIPLLLDFFKGILCATWGLFAMPGSGFVILAGIFCILGHNFPVFYKFKSNGNAGGFSTFAGMMLVINPLMAVISIIAGLILFFVTRYPTSFVLLSSVIFPILSDRFPLWKFTAENVEEKANFVYSINVVLSWAFPFVLMLLVLVFYGISIGRMVRGKEEKLVFGNKK